MPKGISLHWHPNYALPERKMWPQHKYSDGCRGLAGVTVSQSTSLTAAGDLRGTFLWPLHRLYSKNTFYVLFNLTFMTYL